MPAVSQAQRRAMFAAASGHSTLGIPKKVGQEFVNADKGGKLPARSDKMKYAAGGKVHDDEAEDRKLFGKMITEYEKREDAKGKGPKAASYAAGGAVLAHSGDFFKTPDTFRTDKQKQDYSDKGGEKARAKEKSDVKQNKPRG